jgi:hypothetical protein|tara:strand:- start:4331 stop:4759 length:429 start_codon:yes stop_codon:yes gene_type:complete
MPKSKLHISKINREFLHLNDKYVKSNELKYMGLAVRDMVKSEDFNRVQLETMLYLYDLEFFEITWAAKQMGVSRRYFYEQTILPLKKSGYLTEYLHPTKDRESVDVFFDVKRNAQKLSLSHKGRHAVQRLYRKIRGDEEIRY